MNKAKNGIQVSPWVAIIIILTLMIVCVVAAGTALENTPRFQQTATARAAFKFAPSAQATTATFSPLVKASSTIMPAATLAPSQTMLVIATQAPIAISTLAHPSGTSGKCRDGTYTSASHKQGACSSHDGVAEWWGQ